MQLLYAYQKIYQDIKTIDSSKSKIDLFVNIQPVLIDPIYCFYINLNISHKTRHLLNMCV